MYAVLATAAVLGIAVAMLVGSTAAAIGAEGVNIGNSDNTEFDSDLKEISFVAFCNSGGSVSIDETYTDGEGEVVSIDWSSDTGIQTVVLKYGTTLEYFDVNGAVVGTVTVGQGDQTSEEVGPVSSPCPEGETELVKYENDDGVFVKAEE